MPISYPRSIKGKKKGFTLVEVLVALLVLAFGLLGLAGIQLYGLRQNQTALYRSLATQMAYDIADRMRANPSGFQAGFYHKGTATTVDDLCIDNTCTPTLMAGFDLKQWNESVATLPLGVGIVCKDNSPTDGTFVAGVLTDGCDTLASTGNHYAVKVWWDERDKNDPGHKLFAMSFQL